VARWKAPSAPSIFEPPERPRGGPSRAEKFRPIPPLVAVPMKLIFPGARIAWCEGHFHSPTPPGFFAAKPRSRPSRKTDCRCQARHAAHARLAPGIRRIPSRLRNLNETPPRSIRSHSTLREERWREGSSCAAPQSSPFLRHLSSLRFHITPSRGQQSQPLQALYKAVSAPFRAAGLPGLPGPWSCGRGIAPCAFTISAPAPFPSPPPLLCGWRGGRRWIAPGKPAASPRPPEARRREASPRARPPALGPTQKSGPFLSPRPPKKFSSDQKKIDPGRRAAVFFK